MRRHLQHGACPLGRPIPPRHRRRTPPPPPCGAVSGNHGGDGPAPASSSSTSASSSSSASASSSSSSNQQPWQLMGRVVREERVAFSQAVDERLNRGLVSAAAAEAAGLEPEEFESRVQRLLSVMPFLEPQLARLRPALLAGLAADPERAAARLVELRALLPRANVAAVLSQRPSLVLDGEWEAVPAGLARLLAYYTEEEAAAMVSVEPCLLLDDVRVVLRELTRLIPGADPVAELARRPGLATQALGLRGLSLW